MYQTPIISHKILDNNKYNKLVEIKFEKITINAEEKITLHLPFLKAERTCPIVMSSMCCVKEIFIPKTLIDIDYNFPPQIYLLNFNDYSVDVDSCLIQMNYMYIDDSQIHTFPLFNQTEEDNLNFDTIKKFKRSTANANGLDIIFNKCYEIHPKGTLELKLPFHFYSSTIYFNNLILLRSSFAMKGLCVVMDYSNLNIVVINYSNHYRFLGERFLQLVLPAPLCFKEK